MSARLANGCGEKCIRMRSPLMGSAPELTREPDSLISVVGSRGASGPIASITT